LFQDAAYKATKNRHRYQLWTNIVAWFKTIMRNEFINWVRKKKLENVIFDGTPNDFYINSWKQHTHNDWMEDLNVDDILKAIEWIDEDLKIPFLLYKDWFKYKEIAEILGSPLWTIKSRIFFARKQIKELLESNP
jgi:RNA polymerase sigma-70 factor (ECF subfamily)